ncbi:MAG: hypothetical protein J7J70_03175, partial [Deltaproteobacteria bacterium]|nr:hypothetical protein [Candidatus Tharpellaceae bacterium]
MEDKDKKGLVGRFFSRKKKPEELPEKLPEKPLESGDKPLAIEENAEEADKADSSTVDQESPAVNGAD